MMKRIGNGFSEQEWNSRIVAQLSFIKKHLRYPLTGRTSRPFIFWAANFLALGFVIYTVVHANAGNHKKAYPFMVVMLFMVVLPGISQLIRYLRTLYFTTVVARPSVATNMFLLERFFQLNNFAYARHSEAPEVFQMLSTNIRSLKGEREIVVFIADEGRILVNSHFTHSRFISPVGSARYREMAKMLSAWLKKQEHANSTHGLQPF
jgi:hypothetical protein